MLHTDSSSERFWLQYGDTCRLQDKLELAEQAYLEARKYGEGYGLFYRLGQLRCQQLRFEEGIEYLKDADRLYPNQPELIFELARAYHQAFEFDQAIRGYQEVLRLDPHSLKCWFYLFASYRALGVTEQARYYLQAYLKGAAESQKVPASDLQTASLNLSLLDTADEDFLTTWKLLADLHSQALESWLPSASRWQGQVHHDRKLAVVAANGLGDVIQMLRFLPELADTGQAFCVWIDSEYGLKRLFDCLAQPVTLCESKQLPKDFDDYLQIMDLPFVPGFDRPAVCQVPYLFPEPGPEHHLQNSGDQRPKIGLVWASGHSDKRYTHWSHRQRSVELELFVQLIMAHPELTFYSLQYGLNASDLEAWPQLPIDNLGPRISDLYDTACFIQQMDLVISVDTSVAHLAGALARPLWLLLPAGCDDRWGQQTETTPWYPTARLFRQQEILDWHPVFEQLQTALMVFSNQHIQPPDQPKSP